jgi:hypothetical protein
MESPSSADVVAEDAEDELGVRYQSVKNATICSRATTYYNNINAL